VLKALDPRDGSVLWERQLPAWVWAPITVAGGVGYVAYEKQLQAFDVRTGAKLFNYRTWGTITSAPVVAGGRIYFGSGLSYLGTHLDQSLHALALGGTFDAGPEPEASVLGPRDARADVLRDAAPDAGSVDASQDGDLDVQRADSGPDAAAPDSAPAVTFSAVYRRVLAGAGCASAFCHGANAGNLDMGTETDAYANLVGVKARGSACGTSDGIRVVPGNPQASLLVDKISNATPRCGTVMPPGNTVTVPAEDVELVRAWIAAGAASD
jgi:hypothetical protein